MAEQKVMQMDLFGEEAFSNEPSPTTPMVDENGKPIVAKMEVNEEPKAEGAKKSPRGNRKIPKGRLVVTFPDDYAIIDNAYVKTIKRIGTERIEKTNLRFAGRKLITATKQYPSQTQLPDGKWLTIPNTTKDKYKMLKIISSMTHTPFDVEITK